MAFSGRLLVLSEDTGGWLLQRALALLPLLLLPAVLLFHRLYDAPEQLLGRPTSQAHKGWSSTWQQQPSTTRSARAAPAPTHQTAVQEKLLRAPDAEVAAGSCWWHSPQATAEEARVIESALVLLGDLQPQPPHFSIALLRVLRAQPKPKRGSAAHLAQVYRAIYEWKVANVHPTIRTEMLASRAAAEGRAEGGSSGGGASRVWPAVRDLPFGEWGAPNAQIGLRCGRTRQGLMPVKLERTGRHDANAAFALEGGEAKMRGFYFSILESAQHTLNAESAEMGVLLRSYDVFDMAGLNLAQLSLPTMAIARLLLGVFASIYAETTGRSVIINLPWALRLPVMGLVNVLPQRVKAKVAVLGPDWQEILAEEVDDEAMRAIVDASFDPTTHRGAVLTAERVLRPT